QARAPEPVDLSGYHYGLGRELFAALRANALGAEQGAITFAAPETGGTVWSLHASPVQDRFAFPEEDSLLEEGEQA
ncbi:MAG TPA: phosphogluconate dehydratase, partial [Burkholderiales bacterium]|nr:phosphogluconate dehydratase [Burkholderiales bacterium]